MSKQKMDLQKTHAINSWVSLITSIFIVVCVFISIVFNLLDQPTESFKEVGIKTFRMFTVLSNMFIGITASMSIPFAVEGIRDRNYHLPRWIVNLSFCSVTCIMLTFIISLCILSPMSGFVKIMASGSNLFLHTFVPLLSISLFLFVNVYHNIKLKNVFYSMIPVLLYGLVYFVLVIAVGEENGGWRDHYYFQKLMPWYFVAIIVLLLTFGLAMLLKFGHNYMHGRDKLATEQFYHFDKKYDLPTIEEAIIQIARENKQYDTAGELIVPRRIIKMLDKKYNSGKSLAYLCTVYVEEYFR